MADTYSTLLRSIIQTTGENSSTWGVKSNTNTGTLLEEAIAGMATLAMADANYTLSTANGSTDEGRKLIIKAAGALTASRNIVCPTLTHHYIVHNACTGGFPVVFKTSAGTGVTIQQDHMAMVYCDGTNVRLALDDIPPGPSAIINGDMNIWQRGTSFAAIASNSFGPDRFKWLFSGAGVVTLSQNADVPTVAQAGRLFKYSANIAVTTVDSSIAAGDYYVFQQPIEGSNWLPLAQRVITLSFWVKAKVTGIHGVSAVNGGSDRSYIGEITILAADTWEFKTVTMTASPSAGTWDYTTGTGLTIGICLAAGSTYQTTANVWQTGVFFTDANQVNQMSSTSNYLRTVGVKLEPGYVATLSTPKPYDQELLDCLRYYASIPFIIRSQAIAGAFQFMPFPTPMRSTPSVSLTGISYTNGSGGTTQNQNSQGAEVSFTASAVGGFMTASLVADAELA